MVSIKSIYTTVFSLFLVVGAYSASIGVLPKRATEDEKTQYLQIHNDLRTQHGADPLSWNDTLADAAQTWANNCVWEHSGGEVGPYGENLAAGYGGGYDIAKALDSWSSEASEYDPSNPQYSHFTQMVWKGTHQLGCAVQTCSRFLDGHDALFYVCEYFPAGNVIGQFDENVEA
ncbi:hypothetical protein VKT23_016260 [Stygiomarasmius scandens]|uniref:SCP domain-containing protein n=1 Tax=Marasmiellus scandens TaxID=2682957 RepID=A0ABR1IY67_9AGAR